MGKWLFIGAKDGTWNTSAVCSCCKSVIGKAFKLSLEEHQETFRIENPYCKKCGAKMEGK